MKPVLSAVLSLSLFFSMTAQASTAERTLIEKVGSAASKNLSKQNFAEVVEAATAEYEMNSPVEGRAERISEELVAMNLISEKSANNLLTVTGTNYQELAESVFSKGLTAQAYNPHVDLAVWSVSGALLVAGYFSSSAALSVTGLVTFGVYAYWR